MRARVAVACLAVVALGAFAQPELPVEMPDTAAELLMLVGWLAVLGVLVFAKELWNRRKRKWDRDEEREVETEMTADLQAANARLEAELKDVAAMYRATKTALAELKGWAGAQPGGLPEFAQGDPQPSAVFTDTEALQQLRREIKG